jgi:hypothetical protein
MQQKNSVTATAQSAQFENGDEGDEGDDLTLTRDADTILRNPFEDDAEDVDDDSDDGLGDDGFPASSWNSQARGSWWRGALARRDMEKFGDGRDDSDSDKEDQHEGDEDEEFGDFAMPEVDKDADASEKDNVIVKPLPVHPPQNQKSSGFTSLWPFSGQPFGSKEKEKERDKSPKTDEPRSERSGTDEITGENGEKIRSTHEAARRTSIEDPDEEEVVV